MNSALFTGMFPSTTELVYVMKSERKTFQQCLSLSLETPHLLPASRNAAFLKRGTSPLCLGCNLCKSPVGQIFFSLPVLWGTWLHKRDHLHLSIRPYDTGKHWEIPQCSLVWPALKIRSVSTFTPGSRAEPLDRHKKSDLWTLATNRRYIFYRCVTLTKPWYYHRVSGLNQQPLTRADIF